MIENRNFKIDNCKAILIFLVVFGHLLEFNITPFNNYILLVIYSFHMPLFVFFSGMLAKYDKGKIVNNIVVPYMSIQLISYIFYNFFQPTDFSLVIGYTSLWYLISLFSWYMLIPFFEKCKHPRVLILIAFLVGLIIGYDKNAISIFSLSRTIVFFPFFLLGFFSKKANFKPLSSKTLYKICMFFLAILIAVFIFIFRNTINVMWAYGSHYYSFLEYNAMIRLIIYIIAVLWLFIFNALIPNIKCFISKIGKNTISIYLFHYFIVYSIFKCSFFENIKHTTIICAVLACIITIILSFDFLTKIFRKNYIKID